MQWPWWHRFNMTNCILKKRPDKNIERSICAPFVLSSTSLIMLMNKGEQYPGVCVFHSTTVEWNLDVWFVFVTHPSNTETRNIVPYTCTCRTPIPVYCKKSSRVNTDIYQTLYHCFDIVTDAALKLRLNFTCFGVKKKNKPWWTKFFFNLKSSCLSQLYPLHLNTYVMGLRPFINILIFQCLGSTWRQILMFIINPHAQMVNHPSTGVFSDLPSNWDVNCCRNYLINDSKIAKYNNANESWEHL